MKHAEYSGQRNRQNIVYLSRWPSLTDSRIGSKKMIEDLENLKSQIKLFLII